MRILLYSDTHHNAWGAPAWPALPAHDVVILAGDISEYSTKHTSLPDALAAIREQTAAPILFVPGNHEFYHQEYASALERMQTDVETLGMVFLHRTRHQIDNVAFHGCTLWSDFRLGGADGHAAVSDLAATRLLDFQRIRYGDDRFSPDDCARIHQEERAWLDTSLDACDAEHQVVVTHFAPIARCICPRHTGDVANPYFIAACEDVATRHTPALWLYGHTHAPADFVEGKTRFVNQARGYPREPVAADGFSEPKVLAIG